MDGGALQQFPGASAELGETDVASTHGDEAFFSVLCTPPLSASCVVVADSSSGESSGDSVSDNGGDAKEDSSSSSSSGGGGRSGGRGGGDNSSSGDGAERVEKVRAMGGVGFAFDRGKGGK